MPDLITFTCIQFVFPTLLVYYLHVSLCSFATTKKTYLKSKDTYDISLILKDRYWLSQSKKTIHIPMLWLYLYLLLIIYLAYQPKERTWSCIHVWKEEKEIIDIHEHIGYIIGSLVFLHILGRIGVINCFLIKKNVLDISYSKW